MTHISAYIHESNILSEVMEKYFGFLTSDHGFTKMPEYGYVREIHNDFIKKDIIINIVYEGNYSIEILKPERFDPELMNGIKKSVEYDYNFFKRCDLLNLDRSKKNVGLILSEQITERVLEYYSKTLKENLDILNGNFPKSSFKYNLIRLSRKMIKQHADIKSLTVRKSFKE